MGSLGLLVGGIRRRTHPSNERRGDEVNEEMPRADERLLAELRDLFERGDPPPAAVAEAAKRSYGWRTVDEELAALTMDTLVDRPLAGVRGTAEPRSLRFEAPGLTIEVEVSGSGAERRRVLGQLVPPRAASIEVSQPDGGGTVEADELGRFAIDGLRAQPLRLRCHLAGQGPVATEWVLV
jgi:hypothetical protein